MLGEIQTFRRSFLGDGAYSSQRLIFLKTSVDMLVSVDLYV